MVLEFFVLRKLKTEVTPKKNQFGGIEGLGTNHYLVEMWTEIMKNLDQDKAVCGLISIDFAKAFNTMSHTECIRTLIEKSFK